MEVEITNSIFGIEIMPNEQMEILQNVRMVLTTIQGEVPLDRSFGINADVLDKPQGRALYRAEVVEAIKRCEPRAKVKKVEYVNDGETGETNLKVILEM